MLPQKEMFAECDQIRQIWFSNLGIFVWLLLDISCIHQSEAVSILVNYTDTYIHVLCFSILTFFFFYASEYQGSGAY